MNYIASPDWSPDGQRIAYFANPPGPDNFDIYVVDAAGGTPQRLTTDPARDADPEWSPDGTSIVFYSRRHNDDPINCSNCNEEIYRLDPQTLIQTRLTNDPLRDEYPSWQAVEALFGDLDCDGDVDLDDLVLSLRQAARMAVTLPQGCGRLD